MIVCIVENIVPVAQRKFLQIGHFRLVYEILKNIITMFYCTPLNTYHLSEEHIFKKIKNN